MIAGARHRPVSGRPRPAVRGPRGWTAGFARACSNAGSRLWPARRATNSTRRGGRSIFAAAGRNCTSSWRCCDRRVDFTVFHVDGREQAKAGRADVAGHVFLPPTLPAHSRRPARCPCFRGKSLAQGRGDARRPAGPRRGRPPAAFGPPAQGKCWRRRENCGLPATAT